jgi:hypothetical protein
VVSAVLHLILLTLWSGLLDLHLLQGDEPAKPQEQPLVFELQEPQRPREVVETPDDARLNEPPENAELASDKNAFARNSESNSHLPLDDPFSKGDLEFRELPTNPMPRGEAGDLGQEEPNPSQQKEAQPNRKEDSESYVSQEFEKFTREYLTKQKTVANPGAQENIPKARYDHQDSRALENGDISFNTYNWNFAPYMLALKKRVERNIFPPPAFTYMGIISGETLLRFKIYPNGELRDLTLITYDGHETLMQTSLRAIEISAPFAVLPSDFPEEYLEVTAKFHYSIVNRN